MRKREDNGQHFARRTWLKPAAFALVATAVAILSFFVPLTSCLRNILEWTHNLGAAGPLVLGVIYIVGCVLMFPCSILTLGAGALFGVPVGFVTISIASTLGATCAFIIGRYLAHDFVADRISSYPGFVAIDSAIAEAGWKIVALVRLSPLFPFNVLNYGFSITSVSLGEYVVASWLGMMPGTLLFVYVGSLAGDLATLGLTGHSRSPEEWAFFAIGLTATVAATAYIARLSRNALKQKLQRGNKQA